VGKQKALLVKSGKRQRCPLCPLLFNIMLAFLARTTGKRKNERGTNKKGRNHITLIGR
jgi:hypothetical protein